MRCLGVCVCVVSVVDGGVGVFVGGADPWLLELELFVRSAAFVLRRDGPTQ